MIAHHADRLDRQQHGKGLPDRIIQTGLADFLEIDRVRLAQYVAALLGHFARNTDGEAGAGEWMAAHKGVRQAELTAQVADLVLEQFAQGLDQLHVHALRQAADIMVGFDRDRGAAGERNRLNHVRI